MKHKQLIALCLGAVMALSVFPEVRAAGTLVPAGSGEKPAEIISHDVTVTINNGFAMTEVSQQFRNPNDKTVEAVYTFPVPKSASLSEISIQTGETVINGEVVDKKTAERIYGEEKSKGSHAALATKEGYQDFKFNVANLKANETATIRFVYYQPLPVDTGVCRYVYPLEEGNTQDEAAMNFWTRNDKPVGKTRVRMIVRSAWPLAGVRTPGGTPAETKAEDLRKGIYDATYELQNGLSKDFVFYYQLTENLPGRLEVIPYRKKGDAEGTFMMVLTPGMDLKKIENGADYLFVLDRSGSMSGEKLRTLAKGVTQTIQKFSGKDRFCIILFDSSAKNMTRGWVDATPENVRKWSEELSRISSGGSTNLYDGIATALRQIDADRVTSIVLVTDGVTNTGVVAPAKFHELLRKQDVRVFGFLMGNSSNWPLMRTICDASGGFYDGVSNDDDIIGKILLAKSKITSESLHDVKVRISGVKTFDTTGDNLKKLYRGQQLVIFGRYQKGGKANVQMKVRYSGREQTYQCKIVLPEEDGDNPELERLWAMSRVEMLEDLANSGMMKSEEANDGIRNLGVKYQLVTDETSMLVLSDEAFAGHKIERHNQARIKAEHQAQSARGKAPVRNYRADIPAHADPEDSVGDQPQQNSGNNFSNRKQNEMFEFKAPRLSGGHGGAIEPFAFLLILVLVCGGLTLAVRRIDPAEDSK